MSRKISLYLNDILKSCRKIMTYTEGMTYEAFLQDDRTYEAVLLNLFPVAHRHSLLKIRSIYSL
jgi:uncharacterized protein with HEPN domain